MIVQHNITSMNANRQLGIVGNNLAKSTEKLSSGYKINRAADDAAGLAISEKMRAQVRGLNRASDNAQDGISLIQTAEGAMDQKHAILQRTRELMVQASNAGVLDGEQENDFQKIQDEIDNLKMSTNRIDTDTEFNKKKLLDGSYKDQWLQVGANSSQGIKVTIKSTSWDDSLYMTKTATYTGNDKGSVSAAGADGTIVAENKDNTKTQYTYNKDVFTVEKSFKAANGSSITAADAATAAGLDGDNLDGDDKALLKKYGYSEDKNGADAMKADTAADKAIFSVTKVNGEGISKLIDNVDTMIKDVTTERSKLGAVQNRLEYTVKVDDNTAENMQSAESRIRDTDMADEMTRFSKESILQQAATSMLAQANQSNQGVLSLLQ
ncbi:MAG: flagellin [Eubacterium sp.]